MPTDEQLNQYRDQGFMIADDAVEPGMLDALEAAARRVRDKVRSGEVDIKSVRADGGEPQVIWGLMAPDFGEPVFADYLISSALMDYVHNFLGEELRLGAVSLFCNANQSTYDTGWHRDMSGRERDADEQQELELLGTHRKDFRKWHLALVDDPCLWVVPGSQRRSRTDLEREVLIDRRHDDLPEQLAIELKRGQTVFWNGNIIHRGRAPERVDERLSLVAHLSRYRADELPGEVDERERWLLADNVRQALPEPMLVLYDRWLALQQDAVSAEPVGS